MQRSIRGNKLKHCSTAYRDTGRRTVAVEFKRYRRDRDDVPDGGFHVSWSEK